MLGIAISSAPELLRPGRASSLDEELQNQVTSLQKTLAYFAGAAIPAIAVWIIIVLQLLGGSLVAAMFGGAIIGVVCMLLVIILPHRGSFPSG